MDSLNSYHCLYCENPRPIITHSARRGGTGGLSSASPIQVGIQTQQDVELTPIIDCRFCKRKYYLFATGENTGFLQNIITRLKYNELIADSMRNNGLEVTDIFQGFIGITGPKSIFDRVYNQGTFHILFKKDQKTYSLICVRTNESRKAINLEEVYI